MSFFWDCLLSNLNYQLFDHWFCRHAFATLSFVAEIFIFLYVGMDALDIEKWRVVSGRYRFLDHREDSLNSITKNWRPIWHVCQSFMILLFSLFFFLVASPGTSLGVSSILLALILVGRAAFVFPLSLLSNLTKKSLNEKINLKQQVTAWHMIRRMANLFVDICWIMEPPLQVTIWWAGLMRGAVSMALAYNQVGRSACCHV